MAQSGGPSQDIESVVGNRHYLKVRWKPSSASQRIVHQQFSVQTYQPTSVGMWQEYTKIDDVRANPGSEVRLLDNGSSSWQPFEADYYYVIDITALGIGNLSQSRMDYWFGVYQKTADATTLTSLGITATAAELNYTDGVTSNIQTQLNNKVDKVAGKGLSKNDPLY